MGDELPHRVAEEMGGGLEPCCVDQRGVDEHLGFGELVLPVGGLDHAAEEIVLRLGPSTSDEILEVLGELGPRDFSGGQILGAGGLFDADGEVVDERAEVLAVLGRHADQRADHVGRQRECHAADKVTLTAEIVEQVVAHLLDLGTQLLDTAGRERAGDEAAHPGVIGRVEHQHRQGAAADLALGAVEGDALVRQAGTAPAPRIAEKRPGVVEPGEDPPTDQFGLEDRGVLPQFGIERIRIRDGLGVGEDLEQCGVGIESHGVRLPVRSLGDQMGLVASSAARPPSPRVAARHLGGDAPSRAARNAPSLGW